MQDAHPAPLAPGQTNIGSITGTAYGGRQPVSGAQVYLLAAKAGANGGYDANGLIRANPQNASTSLLTSQAGTRRNNTALSPLLNDYYVLTDANGDFSLTGDYTCTAGTQVYIYATGGNPGDGINSAATFMAVLGNCPSSGSMASQTPVVLVDEVSTVAAAYGLAGFATDPLHIASAGTSQGMTGIKNAAANAANLYDIGASQSTSGALSSTPGSGTNGVTSTVPEAEINTLGNILAACINSTGPGSFTCSTLFQYATTDGVACSTPPCADQVSDTASAILNIAHNPSSSVSEIFGVAPGIGAPYMPALGAAPNDWTVSLAFNGGSLAHNGIAPRGVAIDATGNIWANSEFNSVVTELTPLGIPFNTSGFPVGGLSLAIDSTSSNLWVGTFGNSTAEFNIASSTFTLHSILPPGIADYQSDIAIDGSGHVWVPLLGNSSVVELDNKGTLQSTTLTGNGLASPQSIAIEPGAAGNIWLGNGVNTEDLPTTLVNTPASAFTNSGAAYAIFQTVPVNVPFSNAIDASGDVWFAATDGNVTKLTSTGVQAFSVSLASGNSVLMTSIAIDGAGNAWATDQGDNTVYELNNAGTMITSAAGFSVLPSASPNSIAIDASGNVWYNSHDTATVRELVGAAVPVVTPIAYGVANNQLGTRP